MSNQKQRLFEVVGKLDKTFNYKLNENNIEEDWGKNLATGALMTAATLGGMSSANAGVRMKPKTDQQTQTSPEQTARINQIQQSNRTTSGIRMNPKSNSELIQMKKGIRENLEGNDQAIIDDILSLDEDINNILNKLAEYGKKGLLTATIVLAVALSSQAQSQNQGMKVIYYSHKYIQGDQENLVYCFMIGISSELSSQFMKSGDIDNAGALIEISKYYENLRDGIKPPELSSLATSNALTLMKHFQNADKETIGRYIQIGKNLHSKINEIEMKDQKQRLFEVMEKVDPNFKRVNELGTKMAGVAINRNLVGNDLRTQQITKDAITSLFSKYIGKDIPFFIKMREGDQPTKFQLVEAEFRRDMSIHSKYSDLDKGSYYVLKLYFYNPTGEDNDAPYAENKKEFIATYILAKDSYDDLTKQYFFNQYAINVLLFAALTIRKAYFNAFPIRKTFNTRNDPDYDSSKPETYGIDQNATEAAMRTRLNKTSFRQFSYDSKSLDNRNHDKPKPSEYS